MNRVLVIFGGKSLEYLISLESAKYVLLNIKNYEVIPMLIGSNGKVISLSQKKLSEILQLEQYLFNHLKFLDIQWPFSKQDLSQFDIVFPLLHGGEGESGQIQGYLDILDIPYVGNGLASSAICLDKIIFKSILKSLKIPTLDYLWFDQILWEKRKDQILLKIRKTIQYPLFIKPNKLGSSIGVYKIETEQDLLENISKVFAYSTRILVEKAKRVKEIEVAILGNRNMHLTIPGEISLVSDFYSYEQKYNKSEAIIHIPAKLLDSQLSKIYTYSKRIYFFLQSRGLCRVDFFLDIDDNKIYLNEINTMPGFTNASLYPKLWLNMGIPIEKILDKLIQLGFKKVEN